MMENNLNNGLTPKGKIFLQIFLRFLKENNYFYNYKKYFEDCKLSNKFERFALSCNCLSPNIIGETIFWEGTEEGFGYWKYANIQFEQLCALIFK